MVLLFKGSCNNVLGPEYRVEPLDDVLCAITLTRCWRKKEDDSDSYDVICACRDFENVDAISLLKDVVLKANPSFAIATQIPFYLPYGLLWFVDVPFRAVWLRNVDEFKSLVEKACTNNPDCVNRMSLPDLGERFANGILVVNPNYDPRYCEKLLKKLMFEE